MCPSYRWSWKWLHARGQRQACTPKFDGRRALEQRAQRASPSVHSGLVLWNPKSLARASPEPVV